MQARRFDVGAVTLTALGVGTCAYPLLFAPPGGDEGEDRALAFWGALIGLPAFLSGVAVITGGLAALGNRSWGKPLGVLASILVVLGAANFAVTSGAA